MATEALSLASLNEDTERLIEKIRRQLGPQICALLADPSVIEIALNTNGTLWVERLGQQMEQIGAMSAAKAEALIGSIAAYYRQTITRQNPIFSGELPGFGARVEAIIPPCSPAPIFTFRLPASQVFTLSMYVAAGILTESQKELIENAINQRKNILVVGGTGSGKTTLANALIAEISRATPEHRLVILEDTAEIQCKAENVVMLRTSESVDLLRLLRETMRLRPDRILVGEVRGPEALALLKAWNTGHPGGVATIHANNARAGLIRLEQLIAEASVTPMKELVAEAVDLIISIVKTPTGRKVNEIMTVNGFSNGEYHFG